MLWCHNTLEMGKARAYFLFLPICEFSARYREEPHEAGDRCRSLLPYFPIWILSQNSLHAEALPAHISRPQSTAFAHGRMRLPRAPSQRLNSSVFTLCSMMRKLRTKFLCSFSSEEQKTPIWMCFLFWGQDVVFTTQSLSRHEYPDGNA